MKTQQEIIERMTQLINDIELFIETNDICNEQVIHLHGITVGYNNLIDFMNNKTFVEEDLESFLKPWI